MECYQVQSRDFEALSLPFARRCDYNIQRVDQCEVATRDSYTILPEMKSAFGSKRKARKIQVDDDDGGSNGEQTAVSATPGKYLTTAATSLADHGNIAD